MKCTEAEDEEPIKGKENQLQLSCFINQEVKYLATGLRLVCVRETQTTFFSVFGVKSNLSVCFNFAETAGRNHKNVSILGKKCPLYKICKCFFHLDILKIVILCPLVFFTFLVFPSPL